MTTLLLIIAVFAAGVAFGWMRRLAAETVGERAVRRLLMAEFGGVGAHLMNNVTLPTDDGSTQVDHILVSRRGVFVIESKHYTGWIFASEKSATWTQVIFKVKNSFQNPLRQNYKHCAAVRKLLEFIPAEQVRSAVVFTGDADFRTGMPCGVFSPSALIGFIRSFPEDAITENRLQFCVGRLECKRMSLTLETDVQHQAALQNRFMKRRS